MKTIVITGPSGSGKTYLSNKITKLFNNSIIINTDSYYRDNLFIRFLSIFLYDIYDRLLSIKKNELNKTLRSIYNKDSLISHYKYDFKRKHSSKSNISINYKEDNQFLILEGIFSHRLDLNYSETINIICEDQKEICFERRLKRDQMERNRDSREVYLKFDRSWYLYYLNVKKYLNKNNVLSIKPREEFCLNKLVFYLQSQKKNN
ncbi:uridine kinase family protein [Prochlorococcus marinus]|uniref:uridine kinase family protein n=1 Tax=Prochlorococcus marinus TaxID=1219 RepID=UPI0022B5DA24|nr:AAA family ATPase [Prochlorococcus marinus]